VQAGEQIATADNTGNSSGSHLHLALKWAGHTYTDANGVSWPRNYFDPTPLLMPFGPTFVGEEKETIDMAQFFLPANGDFGDIVILANNWDEGDERQQLQRDGSVSYVTKNRAYEKRTIGADVISLDMDTSPGGSEFYRVESPTGWMPRRWAPGETFRRREVATFYRKSDCQELRTFSSESLLKFVALHEEWVTQAGLRFENVAEVQWIRNDVVEESYLYASGVGLIAWRNRHGRRSWATELIPRGEQEPNQREAIDCL
jgi:hypothetical protein